MTPDTIMRRIEYGPDGMAARMVFSVFDHPADLSCKVVCPRCWHDTRWYESAIGSPGFCGHCRKWFDAAARDRSPFMVQGGRVLRPTGAKT